MNHAAQLARLHARIRRCTACRLCEGRTNAVPGEGPLDARIMFVGEAPGRREDEVGRPFAGKAGAFLNGLLERHGLRRQDIFITSSVKCRPPGNRKPKDDELATCKRLYLARQIEWIGPAIIVAMGATAAYTLLGLREPMAKLHGQIRDLDGRSVLLTYHPAAAMRFPEPCAGMEKDFVKLAELLGRR